MQINQQTVEEFVKANPKLVRRTASIRYPGLFTLKYDRKVFYDNLWNDILEDLRGTVVDEHYNPVVMPFRKIYNRGERGTDIPRDEEVLAVRKINGFMAGATYNIERDTVIISTTGSTDSKYVALAEKVLGEDIKESLKRWQLDATFLFEIVDPSDPHVVHEEPGHYLIGLRTVKWDSPSGSDLSKESRLDGYSDALGSMRPTSFNIRFSDLVKEHMPEVKHEGYVVYGKDTTLKLKSSYYLITKFLGRMKYDKMRSLLCDPEQLKRKLVDEEFFPLVDYLVEYQQEFLLRDEQQKFQFVKDFLDGKPPIVCLGPPPEAQAHLKLLP